MQPFLVDVLTLYNCNKVAVELTKRWDKALVESYAARPTSFPPIELEDENLTISDGVHRVAAAMLRGDIQIAAVYIRSWQEKKNREGK
jgi:hypothetical protein